MTKKLCLFLVAIMLFVWLRGEAVSAAGDAAFTLQAAYSSQTGTVRIDGQVQSGGGTAVSIKIVYPSGKLYVNQVASDGQGRFSLSYRLSEAASGTYHVVAASEGAGRATADFAVHEGVPTPTASPTATPTPTASPTATPTPTASPTFKPTGNQGASRPVLDQGVWKATIEPKAWDALDAAEVAKQSLVRWVVESVDDAEAISLDFPASMLSDVQKLGASHVAIETQFATVSFAVDALPAGGSGSRLELIVKKVDPKVLPEALRDKPALDFQLKLDGQPIASFMSRKAVQVSLPYTIGQAESPETVVVYYVTADGRSEIVKNGAYDPKTGRASFFAAHFSVYTAGSNPVTFNDLDQVGWAKSSIDRLAARSILSGVGAERFAPERPVTRAEFVKMLVSGLDLAAPQSALELNDVAADAWYAREAAVAAKLGIVKGYANGKFDGSKPISREEMFVMTSRALQAAGTEIVRTRSFDKLKDLDRLSGYAAGDVVSMGEAGLIEGSGGQLRPQAQASRAEAAVLLNRILLYVY